MIIPHLYYSELKALERNVPIHIVNHVYSLINQSKWEKLAKLIGRNSYYETICFFHKFVNLPENIKKQIEFIDIVEK